MFCLAIGWVIVFAIMIFIIAFAFGLAIGLWWGFEIRREVYENSRRGRRI
jgi:hypothetical protein